MADTTKDEGSTVTPHSALLAADEELEKTRALTKLKEALNDRRLVIITGVGVTLDATGYAPKGFLERLTWKGLIEHGVRYLERRPPIANQQKAQESRLKIDNIRHFLSQPLMSSHLQASQILRQELEEQGHFADWLDTVFDNLPIKNEALLRSLKELHDRGATILTTNYDCLLDQYCGLEPICRSATDDLLRFQRGRGSKDGIFHIHGSYQKPGDVVLDPIDYYKVRESEDVRLFLEQCLKWNTVLFVGCGDGLGDENFSALLKWISEKHRNLPHTHTLLIKNDDSYNFNPLVRLKYGSKYNDLGPWLWNELLEHQALSNSTDSSKLPGPSNGIPDRPVSTGVLDRGDSGDISNSDGFIYPENETTTSAKAIYDYTPKPDYYASDIPLRTGEIVYDIDRSSEGWWLGTNSAGKSGLFPSNYVRILPQVLTPSATMGGSRTLAHRSRSEVQEFAALDTSARFVLIGIIAGDGIRADILHNPEHTFKVIYDPGEAIDSPQPVSQSPLDLQGSEEAIDTTTNNSYTDFVAALSVLRLLNDEVIVDTTKPKFALPKPEEQLESSATDHESLQANTQVEPPMTSIILACSNCLAVPTSYPVFECNTCLGKTIICQSCFNNLKSPHQNHHVQLITADLWFNVRSILFKDALPQDDEFSRAAWGLQWEIEAVPTLRLGYNDLTDMEVLTFNPRPCGESRFALINVPAGQWEVRLQISTRPSQIFGKDQLTMCERWKKWLVKAGLIALGVVDIYIGVLDDANEYLVFLQGDPLQMFADNSVRHEVIWGTHEAIKIKLPRSVNVKKGQHVALYVSYHRNSEAFSAERWEVQHNLSFSWSLEGVRLVQRMDLPIIRVASAG
ncbi:SIR2-like domain-containing protein [Aspergillus spinulosporus]